MTHLDYIEREAGKNAEFHLKDMECLNREAHATLSFLFVVVSASFAGAVRLWQTSQFPERGWGLALFSLCLYLSLLAACITRCCLMVEDVMPPSNEPENLKLQEGFVSEQIREAELGNLQKRIDFNAARNERVGDRLNRVRLLICASPVVFLLVALAVFVILRGAGYA